MKHFEDDYLKVERNILLDGREVDGLVGDTGLGVAADVAIFTQRSGGNHQMVRDSVLKEYLRLFFKLENKYFECMTKAR
jgi:hypothetical protein